VSPIALIIIGAGVVLIYAAFRAVSPVQLVTDTLGGKA
jgi:hypothetical protein